MEPITLFGAISGWVALILSGFALWVGWRADGTTRKLLEMLGRLQNELAETREREAAMHEHESNRVDDLIRALTQLIQTYRRR